MTCEVRSQEGLRWAAVARSQPSYLRIPHSEIRIPHTVTTQTENSTNQFHQMIATKKHKNPQKKELQELPVPSSFCDYSCLFVAIPEHRSHCVFTFSSIIEVIGGKCYGIS
jgi:hypothetical protein